jgi:hypothetical protein
VRFCRADAEWAVFKEIKEAALPHLIFSHATDWLRQLSDVVIAVSAY